MEITYPCVDLRSLELERKTGLLIDSKIALKINGVCVGRISDNHLSVVVEDPSETYIYDLIEVSSQGRFKASLLQGDAQLIKLAQEFIYDVPQARHSESWQQWLDTKKYSAQSLERSSRNSEAGERVEVTGAAVEQADRIIKEAIAVGASDIHLETFEDCLLVRYRQDGVLRIVDQVTSYQDARALVKRFKVMANVDISHERITQGGRISVQLDGRGFDLRVSVVPVPEGESLVMRLFSKGSFTTTLAELGMSEQAKKRYRVFLDHPHGIVLACGPTGSGKSTTLYASLKEIARPDRKLLTIEDPIEYQMPGIIQVQVNNAPKEVEHRVTFAAALREFLRQDPDVILVGEIRDEETARTSIQAALTGHLVFSTVHTNDAVGVVNRLKDQGVKPYLIATTLIGAVSQRLVRRICPDCREPYPISPEDQALFELHDVAVSQLYRGRGCPACHGLGYRGRTGLYEVFAASEQIRELIESEATALAITRLARTQGMQSLLDDGLSKAAAGSVTLDEVRRVCIMDL